MVSPDPRLADLYRSRLACGEQPEVCNESEHCHPPNHACAKVRGNIFNPPFLRQSQSGSDRLGRARLGSEALCDEV